MVTLNVFMPPAVGGHACLVCGSLSCQCEEWSHHVSPVRHRDPEGDWHQQPFAPTQTAPGHPGDGLPHQPLCTTHLQNGKKNITHKYTLPTAFLMHLHVQNKGTHYPTENYTQKPLSRRTPVYCLDHSSFCLQPGCFIFICCHKLHGVLLENDTQI